MKLSFTNGFQPWSGRASAQIYGSSENGVVARTRTRRSQTRTLTPWTPLVEYVATNSVWQALTAVERTAWTNWTLSNSQANIWTGTTPVDGSTAARSHWCVASLFSGSLTPLPPPVAPPDYDLSQQWEEFCSYQPDGIDLIAKTPIAQGSKWFLTIQQPSTGIFKPNGRREQFLQTITIPNNLPPQGIFKIPQAILQAIMPTITPANNVWLRPWISDGSYAHAMRDICWKPAPPAPPLGQWMFFDYFYTCTQPSQVTNTRTKAFAAGNVKIMDVVRPQFNCDTTYLFSARLATGYTAADVDHWEISSVWSDGHVNMQPLPSNFTDQLTVILVY